METVAKVENSGTETVAALFVEAGGVYDGLEGVDCWPVERDARRYAGPYPVVAHPPCARWSLMGLCRGYYDGEDEGCFAAALEAVRAFGGVLEHPAYSLAWERFGLPRPAAAGWTRSLLDDGWTCEVDQAHWGHRANKRTWLYYAGPPPPPLRAGRAPFTGITVRNDGGGHTHPDGTHGSRAQRSRTPPAFRDALLDLARSAALVAT